MGKTVNQLLTEISSEELSEWMAYDQLEPFGEDRADWRSGMLAATMANLQRPKHKSAYKPADFMPEFDKKEQDWEEQLEVINQWHMVLSSNEK